MARPGTKVIAEIDHHIEDGVMVREIRWNDTHLRSFDVYVDNECLTMDESLDEFPSAAEIDDLIREHEG